MSLETAEAEYVRLKAAGYDGWGGAHLAARREGWAATLATLRRQDVVPRPPARVLELGCGNGMVASLFAQQGYVIEGVEQPPTAVAWAERLFALAGLDGTFRSCDVCDLSFYGAATFDLAIDGNCLHCLIGADRMRCLSEARRVLRPNGTFVVSTMCGEPKSTRAKTEFDPVSKHLVAYNEPYRTLKSADDIATELKAAGFAPIWRHVQERAWWDHIVMVCVAVT